MAVIDMPLQQLREYQGTNPCPADIDQYWDRAIAQTKAIEPQIELIPAKFSVAFADCFDLYFTGLGGARIHAQLLKPQNITKPCPAILEFHGYSGDAGDWSTKLHYVANGFVVAAMDCRGQGGLSEDIGQVKGTTYRGHIIRGLSGEPEKLLFRQIFADTAQLASIVMDMDEVDQTLVSTRGMSQGGALALACGALEPRIKKVAAALPFLCDYKRVWEMDLETEPYSELKEFFRTFDPTHEKEDEIFTRLGYIDVQNIVKRIKANVLMAVGLRDDICPPSSQFAAYNKIKAEKELVIYPDFTHEILPGFEDKMFEFFCSM
ncbi:acetylxylan esterase [Planctomycetota bacterium]